MATIYVTQQDDVLDAICYRHYGDEHGTTEKVLAQNHALALYDTHLPAGIEITLPELEKPSHVREQVQLWD